MHPQSTPEHAARKPCRVVSCPRPLYCKGYCAWHYDAVRRGHPERLTQPAPLHSTRSLSPQERFWAKMERSGECWLWPGPFFRDGYGMAHWHGATRRAHRVAYELAQGPIPAGLVVAHRCDVPACCRPDHLFVTDVRGNNHDSKRKGRAAKGGAAIPPQSGVAGVTYQAGCGWQSRWVVRVSLNGRRHFVGHFKTVEEAKAARDAFVATHR